MTKRKERPADRPLTTSEKFHAWRAEVGDEQATTELLDFIVSGGSLLSFTKERGFSYTTVLYWINADKTRAVNYAHAREDRTEFQADRVQEVSARDCRMPILDNEGKVVGYKVDPGAVAQAKLEADNLKWIAARMKPKVYGDKIDLTATVDIKEVSDEALAAKARALGIPLTAIASTLGQRAAQAAEDGDGSR